MLQKLPAEILQVILKYALPEEAILEYGDEAPKLRLQAPILRVSQSMRSAAIIAVYNYCSFRIDRPQTLTQYTSKPEALQFCLAGCTHPIVPRCLMLSICVHMAELVPGARPRWDEPLSDNRDTNENDLPGQAELKDWKQSWRAALLTVPLKRVDQSGEDGDIRRVSKLVLDVSLGYRNGRVYDLSHAVGYLSTMAYIRSKGQCVVQVVGCRTRKDQETLETFLPSKTRITTEKAEFQRHLRNAKILESQMPGETYLGTLFDDKSGV